VKVRKDFLDRLFIPLEKDDFLKYLKLLTYPKTLLNFLSERQNVLESERSRLSHLMDIERTNILEQIKEFK
jgi:hypothetical protein